MGLPVDLTGQKFGKLTCLIHETNDAHGKWIWKCLCNCGNIKNVSSNHLRSGKTRSCGCLQREIGVINGLKSFKGEGISGFSTLFQSYKRGARNRKYNWKLSKEQFKKLTSSNCHYCNGIPKNIAISRNIRTSKETLFKGRYIYNGIDRINNNSGYFIENCVTCCEMCNRAKSDVIYDEFISYLNNLVNFRKEIK